MNERQLHFDWNWQLNSTADELWPLISDTNRLYSNLQHSTVQATNLWYNSNGDHAQFTHQGNNHSEVWEEEPYEWQQPFRFGVKRHSKNGSYHYLRTEVELIPNEEGTRVRYQIWMTTENCLSQILTPLRMKIVFRQRLGKTLEKFDALIQQNLLPYQLEEADHLIRG